MVHIYRPQRYGAAAVFATMVASLPPVDAQVSGLGSFLFAGIGRVSATEDTLMLKSVYLSIVGNIGGNRYSKVGPEIVTDTFPKRSSETLRYAISVAEILLDYGEELDLTMPVEFGQVSTDLQLLGENLDVESGRLAITVTGGRDGKSYPLAVWFKTMNGLRLEHQVLIRVRDANKGLQR